MANCSRCGMKLYKWEEKKIGNEIYCEECYEAIKSQENVSTSDPNQENHIKQERVEPTTPVKPGYILTESNIELGFHIAIKESTKKILYGILWFMGGLIATIINPFILFFGAIIFGFYDIAVGIYRYLGIKFKLRKYKNFRDSGQTIDLNDYRLDGILYENLSMIDKEVIINQKKKIRLFIIISLCSSALIFGGILSGDIGWFDYDSVLYDEDFKLTGDGTIPTEDTYLEYMSYSVETEGYDYATIYIDVQVDDGKKVDLHFHDTMSLSLYGGMSGDYIENVSSYSGTYKTSSNAPLTIYVDVWNVNNYEEVTGHIRVE